MHACMLDHHHYGTLYNNACMLVMSYFFTPDLNNRCCRLHYDRAQVDHIKRAISVYDWITELNLRNADPNLQVEHFTEILNNVISNFIPHDDITFNPNVPPWASKNSSRTYHKYRRDINLTSYI